MTQKVFAQEITSVLEERENEKKATVCEVGDLLKGKIIFECADHLRKALSAVDEICYNRGHQILKMTNRLFELQQEVILNIRVKDVVVELKLSLKQDETQMKLAERFG
jgi:hypothetical protein